MTRFRNTSTRLSWLGLALVLLGLVPAHPSSAQGIDLEGRLVRAVSPGARIVGVERSAEVIRAARRRVLADRVGAPHRPAVTEIEQPPLDPRACLEVAVQAVLPNTSPPQVDCVDARPSRRCP